MKLLQAGRLLLIFEGFDEMAEVSDADARFNHFRSLWRFCYPQAKILITGRPNFFLDDRELKALLGVDGSKATGPYVQALHLQPFSTTQIANSLRNAAVRNCREITQLAEKDNKFQDIVSRPSLLYIVNQLWDKPELKKHKQSMNSALVIDLFIQYSYRRQTEKIRDGKQFMELNEAEREYFMNGIAAYMAKEKLPNQITLAAFNTVVEQLYELIPEEVSLQGSALNTGMNKPLKLRLQDKEDPLEAVKTDVRTCGVLVKDLTRPNTLKFPHKSFLELLFAKYAINRLFDKNNASTAAIWAVTKAEPEDLLTLIESLEFAGELLRNIDTIVNKNRQEFQKELFNIIVSTHFPMSYIPNKFIILNSLDRWDRVVIIAIGGIVALALLLIGIIFGGSHLANLLTEGSNGIIALVAILQTLILYPFGFKVSRGRVNIQLWYLLSLIAGVKYKDLAIIYNQNIADKLPQLIEDLNAEYLLEKYNYQESLVRTPRK